MIPSLLVRVIHNGNASRLAETRRSLLAFFGDFLERIPVEVIEEQEPFKKIARGFAARRLFYVFLTEFRSQSRLRTPVIRYLIVLVRFGLDMTSLLTFGWNRMERRTYAELALSKKHIVALENFITSDKQCLLTVEDDIRFSDQSQLELAPTFKALEKLEGQSVFLSLSVAFTSAQLGISKISREYGDGFSIVEGGIANSTAAYMVSKEFAHQALGLLKASPRLIWLPADWLLTELQARISQHVCLHASDGPFINGSLYGLADSEIRP